jgi:prolyl 4-hydroxylase
LHDNIYIIDDYLTTDECNSLIAFTKNCKDHVVDSEDWAYNEDWRLPNPAWKTTIYKGQCKLATDIEERLASTVGIPVENQEHFQVFRSDPSTKAFPPHLDSFKTTSSYYKNVVRLSGNRICTAMLYLSDVEEAGETHFTYFKTKVKPKIGRLLVFKNIVDGKINAETIHEAIPVEKGVKWVLIKWIREYPVR